MAESNAGIRTHLFYKREKKGAGELIKNREKCHNIRRLPSRLQNWEDVSPPLLYKKKEKLKENG
jgi:hypothetical protein